MKEQLKIDFEEILKISNFSEKDIKFKKNYLNKFIESGFPSRKLENWKFLDLNQIIKKDIGELSFYNDYSVTNKVDTSIFIDGLEHNKLVFVNGRIEKIEFDYEEKNKIEILDDLFLEKPKNANNSLLFLNNAFVSKFFKLIIKKNYSLKKPLVIYNITNKDLVSKSINLKFDILLEENSFF